MSNPERRNESHVAPLRGLLCAAALSLFTGQAIAATTEAQAHGMQILACDHPLLVRIDGVPLVGDEEVDPEVRTCGTGFAGHLQYEEDDDPDPVRIHLDPADFPYSMPFELPYSLTLREGKLDVHLELRTDKAKLVYEAKAVALDAKQLRVKPVNGVPGPELVLSVSALNDGVDRVGLKAINTPANQVLTELARVKHLQIQHPELVMANRVTFVMDTAIPVSEVMHLLSDVSEIPVKRDGDKGYIFQEYPPHHDAIKKLRTQAAAYRKSGDKAQLKAALKQILLLAKPRRGEEAPEPVGDLFAEFSLLVMEDKSTPRTEPAYLGQIAQIEHELGPLGNPEYAADLVFEEQRKPSKQVRELALAILEKYPNTKTMPESAGVLADFETSAITAERLDEAESWSQRLYVRLSDPKRSAWDKDSFKHALGQAGAAEQYLGNALDVRNQYAPAEVHYERELTYKEEYYGAESRRTDEARDHVISNAISQRKTERVVEYEARQIALSVKRQNPVSAHYASDLLDLVDIRARQGDLAQVIPLWQHLIDLRRRVRGEASPPVVAGLKVLATLYRQNRQWADAAATDQRIAAIAHPVANAAAAPKSRASLERAMTFDRAPLLICLHGREMESSTTVDPLSIAQHSEQCGEYAVGRDLALAEENFEAAIRQRKAAQGKDHPDTRRTADRAIEIYMKAGEPGGADRVRSLMAQP